MLLDYPRPGNVRELRNIMEYACICTNGSKIELADLPQDFVERVQKRSSTASSEHNGEEEKDLLVNLLQKHGNNRSAVARELGIDRVTLWRCMTRLGFSNVSEVQFIQVESRDSAIFPSATKGLRSCGRQQCAAHGAWR
ncbi:MAG: helix-turn-helix domain-containing protein [Acidithiobacillus sp.]